MAAVVALGVIGAPTADAGTLNRPVRTGCGQAPPVTPGTTTTQHLTSGGLDRSYTVHLPANYNKRKQYSVVVSYHGHKRDSAWQEELSGFSVYDTIAVYPQGLIGTDGESAWTGAPYSAAADDVLFTKDLLDTLQSQYCVDTKRLYAAGKSNGGGFVGVLACRMPDRFAAFAPVSGAFYPQGGDCNPSQHAAIIDFHGTADTTIPYNGNPAKGLPSIQDWLAAWAQRDGCKPVPVTTTPQQGVQVQRWKSCDLVHYQIQGAGHVWPSTKPNPDSQTPTVMDATPVIWDFFRTHQLACDR
ncbi:alpha/beta hydrolase-fold protein [Actinocrispum sp. NPDC049592]|uniref:alpha/beta hydrolase family esterase n=1 Tax=Actinocrispum sp. NPDC049592 TaxID=3154835 RepID=UPI00343DFEB6